MANSQPQLTVSILIVSDTAYANPATDKSIPILTSLLQDVPNSPWSVYHKGIVPDEPSKIREKILWCTDRQHSDIEGSGVVNLVLTSGGTGFAERDCTPEVVASLIQREAPGLV